MLQNRGVRLLGAVPFNELRPLSASWLNAALHGNRTQHQRNLCLCMGILGCAEPSIEFAWRFDAFSQCVPLRSRENRPSAPQLAVSQTAEPNGRCLGD